MKKNKKAYYFVIFGFIAIGFILIWRAYTKPKAIKPAGGPVETITSEDFQENTQIYFASNGTNTVYKIRKEDKWAVIWNGHEGRAYDYVSNPVFSADGTQLAYSAELNGQAWVVLNNEQEIFAYRKAESLVFSSDGKKLAFVAVKDSSCIVVVNGQESRDYQTVASFNTPSGTTSIIFSPDGSQVVYVIEENGHSYIVINGQSGAAFDNITEVYFDNNQLIYQAQQNGETVTVVNNQIIPSQTQTGGNQTASDSSSGSASSNNNSSSGSYRYKRSTNIDINLEGTTQLNYGTCQSEDCNF